MEKKKIMVVDDDAVLSKTIDMCLSNKGHDVRTFRSGADAIRCLFEEKLDLVVLDIRLPDCNGWFLATLLKGLKWAEKLPFIVISVLEPDRGKVAEFKPYAYIQKPFDMGQLVQVVERSLGEEKHTVRA